MRVTYSCPECDAQGFNTRPEFLEHVKSHGDKAVRNVNDKLNAAQEILAES
ncbi:MAG: hypothetical protein JO085_09890 [Acidimicrobiia bacterium]|nr:hypothetical protein [Acidimicrobiia bacterium]MBV8297137.1 hypothetical protein [Acidimicrobiia bacterium]